LLTATTSTTPTTHITMSSKIPGSIKASNRAQALALGGAAVIGMFYFQFRGHQEHQAAKEASQDPSKVPTCA
jgi:hypothetical protein